MKVKYTFLFVLFVVILKAQTFTSNPLLAIPDNTTTTYTMSVSGLPSSMNLLNFGLESAQINITHQKDQDLIITLQSPSGTQVRLTNGNGGTGLNFTNTQFFDTISTNINAGVAPFNNSYAPYDALSNINNGSNPNGTWRLIVRDQAATKTGTLNSWSITFSNKPAGKVSFSSSNLPIVVVNTNSANIPAGTKITATMGVIYNGPNVTNYLSNPHNNYNGYIGIELRGQSSLTFPQKQYGLETRDGVGNNLDVSILGMPPENDWILYAPYNDKSLMRNVITYDLSRKMGRWASRGKMCELVLNGVYQGVYVFQEKIKRDTARVNISKLNPADTIGTQITGGYIINIDKDPASWYSSILPNNSTNNQKIRFTCQEPDTVDIMKKQRKYIKDYVDSFEVALNGPNYQDPLIGYAKYVSVKSFVDYFIINELSKNVDGYRLSTYLYKEKITKGGQLKIGPVWDYNLAFKNANYCSGSTTSGWAYKFNTVCSNDTWQVPFWWDRLMTDSTFKNKLYCRYSELRASYLDTVSLFNTIDSISSLVNQAQVRHFKRFAILGTYVWPNPTPYAKTYAEELTIMKNWIKSRLTWLDANILSFGSCTVATTGLGNNSINEPHVVVYPNPVQDRALVNVKISVPDHYTMKLYDLNGKLVKVVTEEFLEADEYAFYLDDAGMLSRGMYLIRLTSSKGNSTTTKLMKN
ncbi:MAG: CotH kinase family protein [Sphingobacteriaceae bacterium]